MRYVAIAESDIGIDKDTNQDSVLIKHAIYGKTEVLMAIVCDGMGGFSKGEIASATVIREFEEWFSKELPFELTNVDMNVIGGKWSLLLKTLNIRIQEYGQKFGERLGTTFTGTLFVDNKFVIVHVGDTRMYHIGTSLKQLTEDHTFVAREVERGTLTLEQAKTDKRRNMLLQCVGASKVVEPQIISGETEQGVYMLCSDGFRHKVTEDEIYRSFNPKRIKNKQKMHSQSKSLINIIKQRKEKDNISVVLIKSFDRKQMRLFEKIFSSRKRCFLIGMVLVIIGIMLSLCGVLSV